MDSFVGVTRGGAPVVPGRVAESTVGRFVPTPSSSFAVRKNVSPSAATSYWTVTKVAIPPTAATSTSPDRAPAPVTAVEVSVTNSTKSISRTLLKPCALTSG